MKYNFKKHPLVNVKLTSNGYQATIKTLDHVVYFHTGRDWDSRLGGEYINKGKKIYEVLSDKIPDKDFVLLKVFYNQVVRLFDPYGPNHILIGHPQHNIIQEQIDVLTDSIPLSGEGFLIVFKDGGIKVICDLFNLYNEMKFKIGIQP